MAEKKRDLLAEEYQCPNSIRTASKIAVSIPTHNYDTPQHKVRYNWHPQQTISQTNAHFTITNDTKHIQSNHCNLNQYKKYDTRGQSELRIANACTTLEVWYLLQISTGPTPTLPHIILNSLYYRVIFCRRHPGQSTGMYTHRNNPWPVKMSILTQYVFILFSSHIIDRTPHQPTPQ